MTADRTARMALGLTAALGLAVTLLAARTAVPLWRFATTAPELPLWDEAKYGLDGARLAAALHDLDLPRFARLAYDLDVWPPLFPIVESSVFLAAGNQVAVARGLLAVLFPLFVLAVFWAGREIAPVSPAAGVLAAVLALVSPFMQLFATHVMLELPGALLFVLCLAAYARFLRRGERGALVATGLLTAALFFTKYNYGLLWIAPLLVNEAWIACGSPRAMLARGRALLLRIDLRRPFTAFVAVYCGALAAIALTGGGTLRLGGSSLSLKSIGNPLYLLIGILIARAALHPRRAWAGWRRWESGLADRHRVLLRTVGLPAAIWLLLPPHLKSFVDFVENRSTGPPLGSVAAWLYHPRVFVETYHAWWPIGVAVLILVVSALARIGRAAPGARVLLLAAATGLAATALHPYKEPRFFFVSAPLLWLAAAWNVVTIAEAALARVRLPRLATNGVVALSALLLAARAPALAPRLAASFAIYTVPASTGAVVDRILDLAGGRPTLVLGTWNQLSPPLLEWSFLQRGGTAAIAPPELVVPPRRGTTTDRLLRVLRQPNGPPQLVLIDSVAADAPSLEWARAYAEEIAWLEPLEHALATGGAPYELSGMESFAGTGYRLRVYRPISLGSDAIPAG